MTAAARRHRQARSSGVSVNPEMLIQRVTVNAAAGINNRRIHQIGKGVHQKSTQVLLVIRRDHALIGFRIQQLTRAVIGDFEDFVAGVQWKAIPARRIDVGSENCETRRLK